MLDRIVIIVLDQENLNTVPVSVEIAETAAGLRATQNLRTPDAFKLHLLYEKGLLYSEKPRLLWATSGVAKPLSRCW